MGSHRFSRPVLLMVLVMSLIVIVPSASAEQGTICLYDGETCSRNITMAQGHTMYVKYGSNDTVVFMIGDPNGNIIRYANSTHEGYFVDASVEGNYTLVWQSTSPSTSLTYDYNDDVIGFNSPAVQMVILVAIVGVAIVLFVLFRRRKR